MKTKLKLSQAIALAEKIETTLAPACERIEIAGSIRRLRPTVGDIEIVAIPKLRLDIGAQLSLLGDPPKLVSALDIALEKLIEDKPNFRRGDKNGELYKNFAVEIDNDGATVGLDLFLTTADQWGYILALRTGPADFCRALVTPRRKGGLLRGGLSFSGGWLRNGKGEKIITASEDGLFRFIGLEPIPPELRGNWRKYCRPGPGGAS